MKDFLQDLVSHTHSLGVIPMVKITADNTKTEIESISEDLSLIVNAKTHSPVPNLCGVFGMSNLNKLDLHLKCPEYKDNAKITLTTITRGDTVETNGIRFENESGDYTNDYKFMSREVVELKLKGVGCNCSNWDVSFEPSQASIQRFKFQSAVHSDEDLFKFSTKNNNLIVTFGEDNHTYSGNFVFQSEINGSLRNSISIPISEFLSVLNLTGNKTVKIAAIGVVEVTVDSGLAIYNYTFPAHT